MWFLMNTFAGMMNEKWRKCQTGGLRHAAFNGSLVKLFCSASLPAALLSLLKEWKPGILWNKLRHFKSRDSRSLIILTRGHYFPFLYATQITGRLERQRNFYWRVSERIKVGLAVHSWVSSLQPLRILVWSWAGYSMFLSNLYPIIKWASFLLLVVVVRIT